MSVSTNASLRPGAVILYKTFPHGRRKQTNLKSLSNLEKGAKTLYNGWMSDATKRKCKKMINCFIISIKFQSKRMPTFVTLTLPAKQTHTDNDLKRIFTEKFIKWAQRSKGCKHYFWRAEPQKNGNLHFHILFDQFIPWQDIRTRWNNILDQHGYIESYRKSRQEYFKNGFRTNPEFTNHPSRKKQYANYCRIAKREKTNILTFAKWDEWKQKKAYTEGQKNGWSNPNSTDIHALKKVNNIGAYITKYMTKTPDENELQDYRIVKGRIWGSSDSLKDLRYFEETLETKSWNDGVEHLEDFNPDMAIYLQDLTDDKNVKFVEIDGVVSMFLLNDSQDKYLKKYAPRMHLDYTNFYKSQSKTLYQI